MNAHKDHGIREVELYVDKCKYCLGESKPWWDPCINCKGTGRLVEETIDLEVVDEN
jgi:DnaJ-class molecular chaperone